MHPSMLVAGTVVLVGCVGRLQGPSADGGHVPLDAADVSGAIDVTAADTGCDGAGSCNVDFPCGGRRYVCLGTGQWKRVVTRDCSFRCGCTPCSGASCEVDGPVESCAAGTVCTAPFPASGAIDDRPTPCAPPVPEESVEVRTARVRSLLAGRWSGYRFYPGGAETFFRLDLRADGSAALACPYRDVPCTPFGFAAPGDGAGRRWTLDEVGSDSTGRGSLTLPDVVGTPRMLSLSNMVFLPSTRSFRAFSFTLPRDALGVAAQYDLSRLD